MKSQTILLSCALSAASLLGTVATASAARVSVVTARPAATGRLFPGSGYHGTVYRGTVYRSYGYRYGYPYRYGYRYPYRYGYGYPYGYGVGVGYGYPYGYGVGIGIGYGGAYVGGGYGYAPYPAAYAPPVYWARRPYWRHYRRVYYAPVPR